MKEQVFEDLISNGIIRLSDDDMPGCREYLTQKIRAVSSGHTDAPSQLSKLIALLDSVNKEESRRYDQRRFAEMQASTRAAQLSSMDTQRTAKHTLIATAVVGLMQVYVGTQQVKVAVAQVTIADTQSKLDIIDKKLDLLETKTTVKQIRSILEGTVKTNSRLKKSPRN